MISPKHLKRCGIRVVVLNGQASSWTDVKAGVAQGSMLGSLFSLNYINVLSESVKSVKLSNFLQTIHQYFDPNTSAEILNHDLTRISEWHTDGNII